MSDVRISDLAQLTGPVKRDIQNVILDDGVNNHRALLKQLFGSGAGAANRLAFKEEITEITAEMWASIADGTFDKVHVGMHYTAPSGRTYYFADADYFFGSGNTEQTAHHMLVIEDEINHTAQHLQRSHIWKPFRLGVGKQGRAAHERAHGLRQSDLLHRKHRRDVQRWKPLQTALPLPGYA